MTTNFEVSTRVTCGGCHIIRTRLTSWYHSNEWGRNIFSQIWNLSPLNVKAIWRFYHPISIDLCNPHSVWNLEKVHQILCFPTLSIINLMMILSIRKASYKFGLHEAVPPFIWIYFLYITSDILHSLGWRHGFCDFYYVDYGRTARCKAPNMTWLSETLYSHISTSLLC